MTLIPPLVEDALTEDAFLGGRLRLHQPADGYRAAIDPVLLAAAVPAVPDEAVVDLGCGVATAGLCLLTRVPGIRVTGLELQPWLVELARRNAGLNACEERFRVFTGDVAAPPPSLAAGVFDHVMLNPPYLEPGTARASTNELRRIATVEGAAGLGTWLACALSVLRPRGSITVIHRADRLHKILGLLSESCGDVAVCPLWPRGGEGAKRILVQALKGSGGPLRVLPGLALHDAQGCFTPQAEAILRDARGLDL
ncbi:MAG: methyltransferase [Kiloniellaceae bacterium]